MFMYLKYYFLSSLIVDMKSFIHLFARIDRNNLYFKNTELPIG